MTTPAETQAPAGAKPAGSSKPPAAPRPLWTLLADAALDGAIVAFGAWTLLYELATAKQYSAQATALVWIPLAVVTLGLCAWRELRLRRRDDQPQSGRSDSDSVPAPQDTEGRRSRATTALVTVAVGLAVLAAAVPIIWPDQNFLWMWGLLALATLSALGRIALSRVVTQIVEPTRRTHLLAGLVVVALATLTLFIRQGDPDDIYYVNRSVWTAEHDNFSLRDTMFGPETYPASYGGGLPLASIEGLIGALARLAGMNAASFNYLVAATVACLLAGWAAWRLVVAWAPRRHLLVLLGSVALSLSSATGTVGDFTYTRLWTGKVMALLIVLPLAWTYFTRIAQTPGFRANRWPLFMLTMLGLAFVGLTPTAMVMAPVVSAAVVLAAVLTRSRIAQHLSGAFAFSIVPIVSGLVIVVLSENVGGKAPRAPLPWAAFNRTMGDDRMVVGLIVLGLVVGALLANRSRASAALAISSTAAVIAVLVPGVPELINDVTGSGPIYYRLLLVAPVVFLAPMMLAVPLPDAWGRWPRRIVVTALATTFTAILALGGSAPWDRDLGGDLTSAPTLKTNPVAWEALREVMELDPGERVLLPPGVMNAMPIYTTESFPVVPRIFYLSGLAADGGDVAARRTLFRLADGRQQKPPDDQVAGALRTLEVDMVCLPSGNVDRLASVRAAGFGNPRRAGGLVCLTPTGPGRATR